MIIILFDFIMRKVIFSVNYVTFQDKVDDMWPVIAVEVDKDAVSVLKLYKYLLLIHLNSISN